VSDLGSKDPGFDPRLAPKSECMFVNIYHYLVVSYIIRLIVVFRFVQLLIYDIE